MSDLGTYRDIGVSLDGNVATIEIRRPPHNFFDSDLIAEIGEAFERLDADDTCRSIVLCAEGRSSVRSTARRWAAGSAWRWCPISASPAARRGSAPISTGWAFIPVSG